MPTAFVLMVVMKAVEVPTQVNKWAAKETNGIVRASSMGDAILKR